MKNKSLTAAIIALMPLCAAARDFVHPGLSYTDDDLERMRSAIAIGVEPATSTYEALKASPWAQFESGEITPVERISEGQFNNTVGVDGRRIHDLALLYRLNGDRRYADEAVRRINRYKNLRGCSARGTAPLDNGKIYLMIEGAELLRDYDGWSDDDRKAFADMLLYPGYSDTTYPDERRDGFNDEANDINFYWNICNFDTGRWGNQGLFAARALIAIGVFLDNEKIYDRAMRYLLGLEARADDIPYSSNTPERVKLNSDNGCMRDYQVSWYDSGRQFISDEALQYYIYANGQIQEACRDQGHAMVGVGLYTDIAEIAWNQGDDLYGALDNRILLGLEYACRYNLSPKIGMAWEPTGYSENESACTFANSRFYRTDSRSLRWSSLAPSDHGRESAFSNVRFLSQALHHYRDRAGLTPQRYLWLSRAFDHTIGSGIEDWGTGGHHYEWKGWGTLTKTPLPPESGKDETALDRVAADGSKPRYFTLSGLGTRSDSLQPGIYIELSDNKANKIRR